MKGKECALCGKVLLPVVLAVLFSLLMLPGSLFADEAIGRPLDYSGVPTEWLETEADTPTGSSYRLFDIWGGFWADAEKDPDPGDDLLCWAASASNMMEWTGWGFAGGMEFGNTDDFFQFFRAHVTDSGHYIDAGIKWWFKGEIDIEDVDHTGFYTSLDPDDYIFQGWDYENALLYIASGLVSERAVGLSIYSDGGGAHAVTCWGLNYDPDYTASDKEFYLGVWLSDSDSHKNMWNPPDVLRYYAVTWSEANGRWEMPNYGGGWFIHGVTTLALFPGATRPTADAGAPYTGYEGTPLAFDAGGSTDGGTLWYRWDFDNDGVWDTDWLTSATTEWTWDDDYDTDNVYLEVFNERLRDMSMTTVTILNVAPVVTAVADIIDENDYAAVSGTITDPGTEDTFTVVIDWGDGSSDTYDYPAGTTVYSETHRYPDDDPTGTPSDVYPITVTVTDKDGGVGVAATTVTVNNVAPAVTAVGSVIDENDYATVSGTITDPGSLDTFTLIIDWGEGSPITYYYGAGTTTFSETRLYLDDNPTGTPSDVYMITVTVTDDDTGVGVATTTVTVNNVAPVVEEPYISDQPNEEFILPVVHEVDFEVTFTDVGTLDTHTAVWDWGDGTTSVGIVIQGSGSGMVTGSHTYMLPGDYVVTVTVTDDDTGSHSNTMMVHVADVDEALEIFNQYIQDLDDSLFRGKAAPRKSALANMFSALQDKWLEQEYTGMIQDLRNSIRSKADGLIDGKAGDDWIIDLEAQEHICQKVDDITAYLEFLLGE
jgi:hypothetical protein